MDDQHPAQPYPPGSGQPFQYQPPKKKHPLRNVLLVLGVLGVLFCGGCLAVTGVFVNEVDKAIEEEEANDKPKTVEPGKAFQHDGYAVDAGWSVGTDTFGTTIKGPRVTNDGDSARSALLTFSFYDGTEVVGEVSCNSNELQPGDSSKLDCLGDDAIKTNYDEIRVVDLF